MNLGKRIQLLSRILNKVSYQGNKFNKLFVPGKYKGESIRKMSGTGELLLPSVVSELNKLADLKLAESWDNVGLLIEPISPLTVSSMLLTNDLTESVMEEALNLGVDLIISYHPPIFSPLKRITSATWKERIVATCLENKIAVYSPHTAWDAVYGGVTDWLSGAFCGTFDKSQREAISQSNVALEDNYNANVISPSSNIQEILESLPKNKQFTISEISEVSGNNKITRCLLKIVNCTKDEIELFLNLKHTTVTATKSEMKCNKSIGMGRIIYTNGLNVEECVERLKNYTGLPHLRLALGNMKSADSQVGKIALVPGSGASLLRGVQADLYVTGEMFHHDILEANHNGVSVILLNHSDSERGFLNLMKTRMEIIFPKINILVSTFDKDPIVTV